VTYKEGRRQSLPPRAVLEVELCWCVGGRAHTGFRRWW
jgi:hypothetical protein